MDKKKVEYFKKRLLTKQEELLRLVTKSEQDGREADEEATQDIADKAANSYTKEFLFHQSDENRRVLQLRERGAGAHERRHVRTMRGVRGRGPAKAAGGSALGPPLHRVPGKARSRPALVSLGFPPARFVFSQVSNTHSRPPSLLRELLDGFLAVAFPTDCSLCGGELSSDGWLRICRACWAGLQPWRGPLCSRCGLPFPSPRALDSSVGGVRRVPGR